MKFRKPLFVALVALVAASAIGYFSKMTPYYEKLIRIQAEQKLGHIDSRILDEPLDIQALLMDYSDHSEVDPKTGDKDLVLKAWIALSKYPEQSREVFRLYGLRPEFQVILRNYGEPVIPVIKYFLVNDNLSVKAIIGVENAIATVQQDVLSVWNRLKTSTSTNSNPAPQQVKAESGPKERGLYAVISIKNNGYQFLGQFDVDTSKTAHWNQTNRISGGLASFLTGGVSNLERKYELGEDIKIKDVFFATVDVIPFVASLKLLKAGKVVANSGKELSFISQTKVFATRLIPKSVLFQNLGKYGILAATGYVVLKHPELLNSIFASVAKLIGMNSLVFQFVGWFLLISIILYPFLWMLKIISGFLLFFLSWIEQSRNRGESIGINPSANTALV